MDLNIRLYCCFEVSACSLGLVIDTCFGLQPVKCASVVLILQTERKRRFVYWCMSIQFYIHALHVLQRLFFSTH